MSSHILRSIVLVAVLGIAAGAQPSRRIALVGGTLIDGNGGSPQPGAVIQVSDGRIVQVGRAEEFGTSLDGGAILDFGQQVVMPGMVDCHAHPTLNEAVREAALAVAGRTLNA